jgi:uncharacterized delta-60 repeat protein
LFALPGGSSLALLAGGLAKLTPTGALDRSFGFGTGIIPDRAFGMVAAIDSVAVQPDGRIVLGVVRAKSTGGLETVVYRHLPSGERDLTFNSGSGEILLPISGAEVRSNKIVIGAGGGILVGGRRDSQTFVARLTPGGQMDAAFGNGGVRTFDVSPTATESVLSMLEAADGSVLVGGSSPFLARLTPGGALDPAFGGDGVVEQPLPTGWRIRGGAYISLAPDGRVLMFSGGSPSPDDTDDVTLTRYNADGSRDATFRARPTASSEPTSHCRSAPWSAARRSSRKARSSTPEV